MDLQHAWTAAAVLLGFQLTAFTWRLNREVDVHRATRPEDPPQNWLAPSDYLSLFSLLITVVAVFVLPLVFNDRPIFKEKAMDYWAVRAFGLSLILFAGYPFALLGHYNLLFAAP
jgi:hypothetical protein